jgi:hypothetical protein
MGRLIKEVRKSINQTIFVFACDGSSLSQVFKYLKEGQKGE